MVLYTNKSENQPRSPETKQNKHVRTAALIAVLILAGTSLDALNRPVHCQTSV